jgi:hypothetical protein
MSQTLENIFQAIFQGCKQTAKRKKKKKTVLKNVFQLKIFSNKIFYAETNMPFNLESDKTQVQLSIFSKKNVRYYNSIQ